MGVCTCMVTTLALFTVLLLVIAFVPGIPPHGSYEVIQKEESKPLTGKLLPNTVFDGAERIFEGVLNGPEGLASRKPNELFISTVGGYIMRLSGKNMDKLDIITSIGAPCENYWEEGKKCGRPLGISFGRDGKLLVADQHRGIFKVDVDSGEQKRLFDHMVPIDGAVASFINDATEDSSGNIYWSVSSTLTDLSSVIMEMFAGPSGRLLKYDTKTGENTVLIDGIAGSNGVQLSPKENFLLVAESMRNRVLRYWLKGPKAGTHDEFISGLPGSPDNIRANPAGGYDVPLVTVLDPKEVDAAAVLNKLPWLRRLLARSMYGVKIAIDKILESYDCPAIAKMIHELINSTKGLKYSTGTRSMVVQLDASGNIISNMAGDSGKMLLISELEYVGDQVYIGSCCTDYLGVISKAEVKKRMEEEKRQQKPKSKTEL